MAIQFTVSSEFKSKPKGYSGIKRHAEHDPDLNHKNKNIDNLRTEFNDYDNSATRRQNLQKWQQEKFEGFVDAHDKHQRETGHAERQWGTVKNYINRKSKGVGVITIGNVEVQGELMKELCPSDVLTTKHSVEGYDYTTFDLKPDKEIKTEDDRKHQSKVKAEASKFFGCYNRALFRMTENNFYWEKGADGRQVNLSDYLYFGRRSTNVDEGAGHIHVEIATFGYTRSSGKATCALNQALVSVHHAVTGKWASGQKSLRWLRANFDTLAIDNLNHELKRAYNLEKNPVSFYRKTDDNPNLLVGQGMEQFKTLKRAEDNAKKAQKAAEEATKNANAKIKQSNEVSEAAEKVGKQALETQKQINDAAKSLKDAYEAVTASQAVDKDGKELSPLEMAKGLKKASDKLKKDYTDTSNQLDKKYKDLDDADRVLGNERQLILDEQQKLKDQVEADKLERKRKQKQQEAEMQQELDNYQAQVEQQKVQLDKQITEKRGVLQRLDDAIKHKEASLKQVAARVAEYVMKNIAVSPLFKSFIDGVKADIKKQLEQGKEKPDLTKMDNQTLREGIRGVKGEDLVRSQAQNPEYPPLTTDADKLADDVLRETSPVSVVYDKAKMDKYSLDKYTHKEPKNPEPKDTKDTKEKNPDGPSL